MGGERVPQRVTYKGRPKQGKRGTAKVEENEKEGTIVQPLRGEAPPLPPNECTSAPQPTATCRARKDTALQRLIALAPPLPGGRLQEAAIGTRRQTPRESEVQSGSEWSRGAVQRDQRGTAPPRTREWMRGRGEGRRPLKPPPRSGAPQHHDEHHRGNTRNPRLAPPALDAKLRAPHPEATTPRVAAAVGTQTGTD